MAKEDLLHICATVWLAQHCQAPVCPWLLNYIRSEGPCPYRTGDVAYLKTRAGLRKSMEKKPERCAAFRHRQLASCWLHAAEDNALEMLKQAKQETEE